MEGVDEKLTLLEFPYFQILVIMFYVYRFSFLISKSTRYMKVINETNCGALLLRQFDEKNSNLFQFFFSEFWVVIVSHKDPRKD